MSVQSDAAGRFLFPAWRQYETYANVTYGVVTTYKLGYAMPPQFIFVKQLRRSIGPIAFSDTIRIPATHLRIEIDRFKGSDEARVLELTRLAANYTCGGLAETDDMVLLRAIQSEIKDSPLANQLFVPPGFSPHIHSPTYEQWIDAVIEARTRRRHQCC